MSSTGSEKQGFGETFFVPLSDEHLSTLGKIAALFGTIESQIDLLIMMLTGINNFHVLEVLLAGKPLAAKLETLVKLAALSPDQELAQKIRAARQAINAVRAERNHAIHGKWGMLAGGLHTADGKLTPESLEGLKVGAKSQTFSGRPLLADDLDSLLQRTEDACRVVAACLPIDPAQYPLTSFFTEADERP